MKKNFCSLGHIQLAFGFTLLVSCIAIGQVREITGTVIENNLPVKGVSVFQEGSDAVALTGASGKYVVEVLGENPVLIFRHPEYGERRVSVGVGTVLNVSLSSAEKTTATSVGEVVLNAGYYKVKDRERTGSIAKVSAKDIANQPVGNVLSAVQGRMAGVSITQGGGIPGGGFDIQIRGRNSLRTTANSEIDGNQPLYVIDGVPVGGDMKSEFSTLVIPLRSINPLNSINPNDIESIEILKDADATAIYGSRGANGVILVTTKSGKSGKTELSLNTNYGLSRAMIGLKMMDTGQYLGMRAQAYANDGFTSYPANAYDINGKWSRNRYTNWPEKLIGNVAASSSVQLSLKGGSETTSFLLSLGRNEQATVFAKDFTYISHTISGNISHRSKDKKLQLTLSNQFSLQKSNVLNEDSTQKSLLLAPNAPELYKPDGSLNWENNTFTNPLAVYNSTYTNESLQFLSNLNAQFELLPHTLVKLNGGINYKAFEEWSLRPNTIYNPAFVTGQSSFYSSASKSNNNRFSYIVEPQLEWSFKRTGHELTALLGTSIQVEQNSRESMRGSGFESNAFLHNIGAAQTKTIADQVTTEYRYAALFGRLNYQYKNRYIVNLTGRRDGSSRFGENRKLASFGAVGAAWLFSQESFLNSRSWLSFGKLRGSYGITGSDNIGDYQYLDNYLVSEYIYNSVTGLVPSRLYNPDYSWEKTRKLETALEMGFFKDRVNINASWYRNISSNQLVGYQLPSMTGFTSVLSNMDAVVENKGWEVELSARPLSGQSVKWISGFNISFPKNKLLSFPGLEGSPYENKLVIGMPVSVVRLFELEGIDPQTGLYRFKDFNGDGKITAPEDNKVTKNIGVRYFGGWSNTLQYREWDLSVLFQFVKQRNLNYNSSMPLPGGMFNQPVEVLDVWSPDNPSGYYMPYSTGTVGDQNTAQDNFRNSTASVSDASFIRLKNIQLTYTLPLQSRVVKNVKIYFQGQNLLTWTKYFGMDPEFTAGGFLPPLRTYSFGTQINF
ncbi:SusC/RagA family TonB-linked outer membrane protein [Chryseobacterium sp. OV279]|uniref:SusC/RagA family TonB-linked outer membrane protein n=1 Tax=Chryseobacterium sp. OV279 TaxID=1500285 RepID=UPI0009242909|nr:SusC/RagA family TonB-linked outer membrane protein [Chryseobacterium sp. OV279]SHF82197.1 TonB-linked outer membrane protein, SusC/RagA family [Chryseobacterium sp. OV279]